MIRTGLGATLALAVGLDAPVMASEAWQPVIEPGPSDCRAPGGAVELATGVQHACARLADGTVACWGSNRRGELGDGTRVSRSYPLVVPRLTGVRRLMASGSRTCALTAAGSVHCWPDAACTMLEDGGLRCGDQLLPYLGGDDRAGPWQPGRGRPAPVAPLQGAMEIALGNDLVVGWMPSGRLVGHSWTWRPPPLPLARAARIWAGHYLVCAAARGGAITCAGNEGPAVWPGAPAYYLPRVRDLALDFEHHCLLLVDGRLQCAQRRGGWQRPRTEELREVTAVAVGLGHGCAVHGRGKVSCWGRILWRTRDEGARGGSDAPVEVAGLPAIVEVRVGWGHVCARAAGGGVFCWGINQHGQLGDATTTERASPAAVSWCPAGAVAVEPPAPAKAPVIARLARGLCFGHCPQYRILVHGDGSAFYQGESGVAVPELRRRTLTAAQMAELRSAFAAARFESLDERCCGGGMIKDVPSFALSLAVGERLKTIHSYDVTDDLIPPAIRKLADRFDEILGTAPLVGKRGPSNQLR